jgi:four helix bundle protein
MIRSYRDLIVWQRAIQLAENCYRIAATLPPHEAFGLANQLRRSAVSVPANIAEGHGRLHRRDYLRYLSIARGSLFELQTLLHLTSSLHGSDTVPATQLAAETARMLNSLIKNLRAPVPNP